MLHDCSAFVFDLDGTLVTSDLDFVAMKAGVVALAVEAGVAASELEERDILGAVDFVCARLPAGAGFQERADALLARWEMEGARNAVEIAGSIEFLNRLRAGGARIGIVTRNSRAAASETLRRIPLPHDVLLTRDDVANAKPHPEHLSRMMEVLPADKDRAVMVGDHWMDVLAGRRAGMRTVGVLGAHGPERFAPEPPDLLVSSVAELAAYVGCDG